MRAVLLEGAVFSIEERQLDGLPQVVSLRAPKPAPRPGK
jgi:hypothetical protein